MMGAPVVDAAALGKKIWMNFVAKVEMTGIYRKREVRTGVVLTEMPSLLGCDVAS